jgi:hypothetical protein
VTEQPFTEPGLTEETRKQIMADIDRQIHHELNPALEAHYKAFVAVVDEIFSGVKRPQETWLIRQLKNMRIDAQLAGLDHEADVLTQAITELGGTV